jgi:hypothetical protein
MKTSNFIILILLLSNFVNASELLPFPEKSRSSVPNDDQQALRDFNRRISTLDCNSLQGVRDGLIERRDLSQTLFDRNFYQERLNVVERAGDQLNCPW